MKEIGKRPLILITNDDGITSRGIRTLVETAIEFGEVVVVAPDSPQSGMGHAVSIARPLRLTKVDIFKDLGVEAYQCSGTPVDCVKMAHDVVLKRLPDFCFSGINHGSNEAINVIYSGTMSAAMEAAIEGIPSAGFSNVNFNFDADMGIAAEVATSVIEMMVTTQLPPNFLLNVNIPNVSADQFKGIKVCKQADAHWAENFIQRKDPRGEDYYWMTGTFETRGSTEDTDSIALQQGYASVVPVTFDFTHYNNLRWLELHWTKRK